MYMLISGSNRGQAAIEYLAYFAFFLLVAAVFSAFVFSQSSQEMAKRSQERFKSTIYYVAQGVIDADAISRYADDMEINITLPVVVKGTNITIQGDESKGLVWGNTTIGESSVYYYVKTGYFNVDVEQGKYGDENVLTVSKK
ncbi:MAG: hypothetical protein ACP5H8_01240 [Candidatus Micrarchaeia archaeon]